jgi:3-deoxy-manno-octulosonate cytidylyltransferase (CMP-KDO synthetase)
LKVVGAIPARWGSTRLPGKSLISICGKPLIQWVIERARQAKSLDDLVVATDDERIVKAVTQIGARAVMTAPTHPSGTDRVAEAVRGSGAEIVINIQGDEPLIDPKLIDRLADVMKKDPRWDMATAAVPIETPDDLADPSVVKVVWAEEHRALYFSRSVIPFVRDQDAPRDTAIHWRHLGIYAYRHAFMETLVRTPPSLLEKLEKLEQLRALHIGARMVVLESSEKAVGVDTPGDVAHVEAILRKLHGA